MQIGIPAETKPMEGRIALIPSDCAVLVQAGHNVLVQQSAGVSSGYSDNDYLAVGVEIIESAREVYQLSELIVKVKEPVGKEIDYLSSKHTLFCYLHLAANPDLTTSLQAANLTAIAFETVEVDKILPLLAPMSKIAGRVAVQVGTHLLHSPQGGKGLLLGGITGTERGQVIVLGGGVAGSNAAQLAASAGADVTVFDRQAIVLEHIKKTTPDINTQLANPQAISDAIRTADLVIGAVLVVGARAPIVVTKEMIHSMQSGSVVVDISVDQGGCIETTHPTSYDAPTYLVNGVTHFCVSNMPGAVPRTGSQALSAAIAPFVKRIADDNNWHNSNDLGKGINVANGKIIHPAVRKEND